MALKDIWDILLTAGNLHQAKVAYMDPLSQFAYTYGDLLLRSTRTAAWMQSHGVKRGSRVAVMLHNSFEVIQLHFAAAALHAVVVNVNTHCVAREISLIIQDATPVVAFVDSEGANAFASAIDSVTQAAALTDDTYKLCIKQVVVVKSSAQTVAIQADDLYVSFEVTQVADVQLQKDSSFSHTDGYQMYYTSGTTGRPKGVVLSHHIVLTHALGTIQGRPAAYPMWRVLQRSILKSQSHGVRTPGLLPAISPDSCLCLQRCRWAAGMYGCMWRRCFIWLTCLPSMPSLWWEADTSFCRASVLTKHCS